MIVPCPSCGKPNPPWAQRCARCGHELADVDAPNAPVRPRADGTTEEPVQADQAAESAPSLWRAAPGRTSPPPASVEPIADEGGVRPLARPWGEAGPVLSGQPWPELPAEALDAFQAAKPEQADASPVDAAIHPATPGPWLVPEDAPGIAATPAVPPVFGSARELSAGMRPQRASSLRAEESGSARVEPSLHIDPAADSLPAPPAEPTISITSHARSKPVIEAQPSRSSRALLYLIAVVAILALGAWAIGYIMLTAPEGGAESDGLAELMSRATDRLRSWGLLP